MDGGVRVRKSSCIRIRILLALNGRVYVWCNQYRWCEQALWTSYMKAMRTRITICVLSYYDRISPYYDVYCGRAGTRAKPSRPVARMFCVRAVVLIYLLLRSIAVLWYRMNHVHARVSASQEAIRTGGGAGALVKYLYCL